MKKLLALIAVIMALVMLVACGGDKEGGNTGTVKTGADVDFTVLDSYFDEMLYQYDDYDAVEGFTTAGYLIAYDEANETELADWWLTTDVLYYVDAFEVESQHEGYKTYALDTYCYQYGEYWDDEIPDGFPLDYVNLSSSYINLPDIYDGYSGLRLPLNYTEQKVDCTRTSREGTKYAYTLYTYVDDEELGGWQYSDWEAYEDGSGDYCLICFAYTVYVSVPEGYENLVIGCCTAGDMTYQECQDLWDVVDSSNDVYAEDLNEYNGAGYFTLEELLADTEQYYAEKNAAAV